VVAGFKTISAGANSDWLADITQGDGMNLAMGSGRHAGKRQTIIDNGVTVSRDTGCHSRGCENAPDVLRRQTMWPELAVIKMTPGNEMVMVWAQAQVVALPNVVAVEGQAHAGRKGGSWR